MRQFSETLDIQTNGQRLIEITNKISDFVHQSKINTGIINLSIMHTSASLLVQENADPDVLTDLLSYFDRLVPMNPKLYVHGVEGKDDMPAHIKTALTQTHLTLSVQDRNLALGTWQGIYLFEHRLQSHHRKVLMHILGE
jgi:secondary thiamine-phosphate synthase enzyme